MGIKVIKISLDIDNGLDLHEILIKSKELGFYRIFLEFGKKMTTSFLYKNLIDDFILFEFFIFNDFILFVVNNC